MKDSVGSSSGKAIKITPDELIFEQVVTNQTYVQQITLKNNLSAPVEITLKSSNQERLEVEPKFKKLAPFESCVIDVTIKINKPFPAKTAKQKDTIFIKSDFFDQKVNVTIIPSSLGQGATPRDSSLGSSNRFNNNIKESSSNNLLVPRLNIKRDVSKENKVLQQQFGGSKDFSPKASFSGMPSIERELELKSTQLINLAEQLEKQELEAQSTLQQLNLEVQKRKELEDKLYGATGNSNKEYLDDVRIILREREPNLEQLMDLTLKKERDQQERKDAKILDILRVKDKVIEEIKLKGENLEAEYASVVSAFQETKKEMRKLKEENDKYKTIIQELQSQLEKQQLHLNSIESKDASMRLQQMDQQLNQANDMVRQLQEQLWQGEQNLSEKSQNEAFFNEAIERLKSQLKDKDNLQQSLERDLTHHKEDKIRSEEKINQLMNQLAQINQEQQNDRNLNYQKIKSDHDVIERITRLQDDKTELLKAIDLQKRSQNDEHEKMRHILDRLSSIRGLGPLQNSTQQNLSVIDQLERRFDEIARILRETEEENNDLRTKLKRETDLLKTVEQELQLVMEENGLLQSKIQTKKRVNSTQTQMDMYELDKILKNFNDVREKGEDSEGQVQILQKEISSYQQKVRQLQNELEKSSQELNMVIRSQQNLQNSQADYGYNRSLQGGDIGNNSDEIVSRLNAKITSMKVNEEKLVQQIAQMSTQLQEGSVQSHYNNRELLVSTNKGAAQHSSQRMIGLEEKLGEYEIILMQQKEQLIKLEESNSQLNQEVNYLSRSKENELEQLQLRIKNLNEINKKHEQLSTNRDIRMSTDTGLGFSISGKSTAAETERMRQYAQQMELNNMSLKHTIDTMQIEKDQALNECSELRQELAMNQKELIRLRQDMKLISVGINDSEQYVEKISELKNKIKQLEGQINTAKQDFEKQNHGQYQGKHSTKFAWSGQRLEDVLLTNENLRNEHQRAIAELIDIKEEYSNKLHQFSSDYEAASQKLKLDNMSLQRKLETLTSQIQYMEKKELRLFGQAEEMKRIQAQETEEKEYRLKELDNLIIQKDETINELEREIKQKDRSLRERQDQISVLIDTLENEHSSDELRQKVLNLSAELCSLKSIEAQQERRANEIFHQLKMFEQNHQKDSKMIDSLKQAKKEMQNEIDKNTNLMYEQLNKFQELEMANSDTIKECGEWKYKCERQEFQLTLKEDTLSQLREQIKRNESQFKEQVNRLRKDFTEKSINNVNQDNQINKTLQFKQSIQQLHLVLADYLQQGVQPAEQLLVQDFEKTLTIASQTIERIQSNLDKQEQTTAYLKNDYRALSHNQILIGRCELLETKLKNLELSFDKREEQRWQYQKQVETSYSKVIKEQESKIAYYESQHTNLTESNTQLASQLEDIKLQKEELELSLVCFQQEIDNQRLAMERKAELSVDERYKSKNEAIKTYFDSNITKILLSQGTSNKFLELGREICSLKIVIQNLEAKLIAGQSEREGLEQNLQRMKNQAQQYETKIREQQAKLRKQQSSLQANDMAMKMDLEKKKQENLQLEKELIKAREIIDEKTRNLNQFQNKSNEQNIIKPEVIDSADQKERLSNAYKEISELQEQIVELRSQHIQEIEECRIQYDIDVAETKRLLNEEKQQMEKRFKPGQAPGDLIEKNDQLRNKVSEMRQALDNLNQENVILRKKVESEKANSQIQLKELQVHKQVIQDLESTMIEGSYSQNQNLQMQVTQRSQVPQKQEQKRQSSKGATSHKKNQQLQFTRDSGQNEETDQMMQSKIFQQDSSLNVSSMTNIMNPRLSQSMVGNGVLGAPSKQFSINPPAIVKALVQSKICEIKASSKIVELIQTETNLRESLKSLTIKLREAEAQNKNNGEKVNFDQEIDYQNRKLLELEIENEDLKIAIAQSQINNIQNNSNQPEMREQQRNDIPIQDYTILVESILSLTTQLAKQENGNQNISLLSVANAEMIEQAQRMVIKSLADKLYAGRSHIDLQYIPSEEQDRKIWYLELLEQQLDSSDQSIKTLQNFIKKLQIEITGNLQSAAQIKASSMDLAQNTKKTSEEIKVVGQIIGLIKHDIQSIASKQVQKPQQQTMSKTAVNPFLDIIDPRATVQQAKGPQYDNLIQSNEALQNQLIITEKVKKSLEQEIVTLKINHAQELQQINNQLHQSSDQRDSLLQNNEELHEKVLNLESHLDNLKTEINSLNISYENNQHILFEKEKEKEQLAKTKTATSKHLQKLQQDLQDWRKQTDENMKIKDKQVTELTSANQLITQERDRLKAENQMLRKNQKDKVKGESEEVKRLEQENKELIDKLNQEIESRKKEIEYWITERATMREMIDQLESDKAGGDIKQGEILGTTEEQLKQLKKKSMKKLKIKDSEIKTKDKQVQELMSELQKVKMAATQLEQKMREILTQNSEAEERVKFYQQKLREVELEKDLVLAEKNNAISSNDYTAYQIQVELNSLRECFSKLKIERDNLLFDIESNSQKETEWKDTCEKMSEEIKSLENQLSSKTHEKGAQIQVLESKNNALLQDVKYLRQENERIKQRIKDADSSVLDQEKRIHDEDMKVQEQKYQNDTLQRQISEQQQQLARRDQLIQDLQGQIVLVEGARFKDIEALKDKLQDVKDQNAQVVTLYESQLEYLKSKFVTDKKISEQKSDQVFSLGQREAVIKSLKKENQQLKGTVQKLKTKNKELKLVSQKSENVSVNQGKGVKATLNKPTKQNSTISYQEDNQQEKAVIKIAEMLSSDEGFKGMLEQLQKTNELVYKIVEYEASVAKMESQSMVMTQQLQQHQDHNQQMAQQLEELSRKDLKESKIQKQSLIQNESTKSYKQEIKSLQAEIRQIKEDWLSPEDFRALQDQLRDQQQQVKAAKDEVQRKREVINTIKQQRDQTENEANQIMQNMEGLKDDNSKQQKILREHSRNLAAMKELKQNNDYLKAQEKRLKDEISNLNEKLKLAKVDIQRKDQLIKDFKDKLDAVQDEVNQSCERQNEVEKLREQVKKNRLEMEIKDNQVRAIRQKLEHTEEEYEQLKNQQQSNMMNSQTNQQSMDQQVKTSKIKLKKYELYLKKSLEALRKIGKELAATQQQNGKSTAKKKQQLLADNPLMISELDRDMYKDSVNILGVSMDELAEFMNPTGYGGVNQSAQSDIRHNESSTFIAKMDKALELPETLNADIDQICNYCVKLINEIGSDAGGFM